MADQESADNTSAEKPKKNKRDDVKFWQRWVPAAKRAAHRHWEDSRDAWREFDGGTDRLNSPNSSRNWERLGSDDWEGERYPAYWQCVQTAKSAYWSRVPETFVRRLFGYQDQVMQEGCYIVEKLGEYGKEQGEYDTAMNDATYELLNADKATTQVCYEYAETQGQQQTPVTPGANPDEYVDPATGQPVMEEILQDPVSGGYFYNKVVEEISRQKIYAKSVPYDHIIHTPTARNFEDIEDIGLYFCFTKPEAIEYFGQEVVDKWPEFIWKHTRNINNDEDTERDRNSKEEEKLVEKIVEGWTLWSMPVEKVYWYCPNLSTDFLFVQKDPMHFKGFFPVQKFVIGTKPNKHMYPTPVYVRIRPTLQMLHIMYGRVFNLLDAARRRCLVNASPEVVAAMNDLGEAEFISVQNWEQLVGPNGALKDLLWDVPVQELVNCIGELNNQDDKFKNNVFEWYGLPDILRGQTDPVETATAIEEKVSAAHDRFKSLKRDLADLGRDTLRMIIDAYLYLYDDEKIKEICGFKYRTPEQQASFLQALPALRNDTEQAIRLDIETDTTSFFGEQIRSQQRNAAIKTVIEGLAQIEPMIEKNPNAAATGYHIMAESLDGIGGGRQFIDEAKRLIGDLAKQASTPKTPPPDYEAMKIQIMQQDSQTKAQEAQTRAQEVQLRAQQFQLESQIKMQEASARIQKEQIESQASVNREMIIAQATNQKVAVEDKKVEYDFQLGAKDLEIKAQQIMGEQQIDQMKAELETFKSQMEAQINEKQLQLDSAVELARMKEALMEEARLKRQEDIDALHLLHETRKTELSTMPAQSAASSSQSPPVINVHIGGKKKIKLRKTADGVEGESVHVAEDSSTNE